MRCTETYSTGSGLPVSLCTFVETSSSPTHSMHVKHSFTIFLMVVAARFFMVSAFQASRHGLTLVRRSSIRTRAFQNSRKQLQQSFALYGSSSNSSTAKTIEVLPKKHLINVKGDSFQDSELESIVKGKRVAFYFGAGWCPMCRELEFMLPQYMNALEDSEQPIELIYVSSDRSLEMQLDRMEKLNMKMAISVEDKLSDELKLKYKVWSGMEGQMNKAFEGQTRRGGIPAFIVVDAEEGEELAYLDTESKSVSGLSDWPLDDEKGIF